MPSYFQLSRLLNRTTFGLLVISLIGIIGTSCTKKSSISTAQKAKQIPLRDFFKNPVATGYNLSPDGKWLVYKKPYQSRLKIFIRKTDDPATEKRLTDFTDRDISGASWKGNDHILFSRDFNGDENFHIFSVNIHTGKTKDLTPFKGVKAHIIDDLEDIDEQNILVSTNKRDRKIFDVYRLNITNGVISLIAKNPGTYSGWMTDHNGKLRIALSSDGVKSSLYYRKTETTPFKKIITTSFKDELSPLFFSFDNKNLIASSNLERDKSALIEYNIEKKTESRIIFKHPDVDVTNLSYSRLRKVFVAAIYYTDKKNLQFFDPIIQKYYKSIQTKLPGQEISLLSHDKKEKLWIARSYNDRTRGSYYLYRAETDTLEHLEDISPWIPEDQMASMKPIRYQSRDGLTIHGYLTLPRGAEETKNLPIIINPHGGPWARDHWGFNSEVQLLANRGYGVLQMNFRGSTGYGKKFWMASFKEWGKKMQNDITDGVQWLIDQKIADPKRVCIYGGSYGGYAVLAGLTFTPDLYACGIDYVGISSLFTFMKSIPPYWKLYLDMLYEMVGNPNTEKELLKAASPIFHVDQIKAPLLIAQGAQDPRVNKSESDQIVAALKKRGIDVPYIVKQNEGHGFHNEENRFEFYEAMEKFLAKYLNTSEEKSN